MPLPSSSCLDSRLLISARVVSTSLLHSQRRYCVASRAQRLSGPSFSLAEQAAPPEYDGECHETCMTAGGGRCEEV